MLKWSGSHAAVAVLFCAAAAIVYVLPEPAMGGSNLAACPMTIADLSGHDVSVEQFVIDELEASDMIFRTYRGGEGGEDVWLVVAYFENARYGAHDPKVCYRSQGWRCSDLAPMKLTTSSGLPMAADVFGVERRDEQRLVAYWWYIDDERATGDHRAFLNTMALDGILRGKSQGSFVRVSTRAWPSPEAARVRLERFSGRVLVELPALFHPAGEGER